MRGVILVTDHDWYQFLSRRVDLDEVNFWRPSDTRKPHLEPGTPALFKLRKRHGGRIVGFGIFARHHVLPAWLAWDTFEEKNGAASFGDMRTRIERLRRRPFSGTSKTGDYHIGCLTLCEPVFFQPEESVIPPKDWPDNVVQQRSYDLAVGEGARVWDECLARTERASPTVAKEIRAAEKEARYGSAVLVRPRLGQGTFRWAVIDAYDGACAVTSEHSLPALEAAHIRPFSEQGPRDVSNGLLLRSDIHRLFDKGYVGVTPEHKFIVSQRLRADFENGRTYYPLEGRPIHLPALAGNRPDPNQLAWHLENTFRG